MYSYMLKFDKATSLLNLFYFKGCVIVYQNQMFLLFSGFTSTVSILFYNFMNSFIVISIAQYKEYII